MVLSLQNPRQNSEKYFLNSTEKPRGKSLELKNQPGGEMEECGAYFLIAQISLEPQPNVVCESKEAIAGDSYIGTPKRNSGNEFYYV